MNQHLVKNLTYFISKPFPLRLLRKFSNENFIFPFYHLIADNVPLHIKHLYPVVSQKQFLSDLNFLFKHFIPANFEDVSAYIKNNKKLSKPLFFLSFDDGMRECYDIIYPILKKRGLQAAFFINPVFVDNNELFFKHKISLIIEKIKGGITDQVLSGINDRLKGIQLFYPYPLKGNKFKINKSFKVPFRGFRGDKTMPLLKNLPQNHDAAIIELIHHLEYKHLNLINEIGNLCEIDFNHYLKEHQPYMTLEQIRRLQNEGFIIGSHSFDHPEFRKIDEGKMRQQIKKSLDYIQEKINPDVLSFAFPFTDHEIPASFFDYLYNEVNLDVTFGTAGIKRDSAIKHIQRIPMEEGRKNAERIIREEYAYFWGKSFFGKNTIDRK